MFILLCCLLYIGGLALTFSAIDDKVREVAIKVDNAFKYRIQKAKKKAVHVGIFDKSTKLLSEIKIESEEEIPDDVKNDVMKWHYL